MRSIATGILCLILGLASGSVAAQGKNEETETPEIQKETVSSKNTKESHSGEVKKRPGSPRLILDLADGSRLVGTTGLEQLKLTTPYASLEIRLESFRAIHFTGTNHATRVQMQNGDQLSGTISAEKLSLKTISGQFPIPFNIIRDLRVSSSQTALPDGLVLHYTFDGVEGDQIKDESGSGSDGKLEGATITPDGKFGSGLLIQGNGQSVRVVNPAKLRLQNFTILAWVKRNPPDQDGDDVRSEDGAIFGFGQGGYLLGMSPSGYLFLTKTGIDNVRAKCRLSDNRFHQVAVTKSGNEVIFYMDGVAYPSTAYEPGFVFSTPAAVGARYDLSNDGFPGVIDDVAVFNRALSGDEIKAIFDSAN